ncbi:MAG: hypothetical protein LN417_09675 [Candidatus Thermoplasmatota archaeon]|nr:hypothetical protein [Candidatus Thermoplasmatota archaeon]
MATVAVERVENVLREFDRQGAFWAKTRTGPQILSRRLWRVLEAAGKP